MEKVQVDKRDLMMPLFIQIVGDFDDVKKLYADGKTVEAYDLFRKKYQEIQSSTHIKKPVTTRNIPKS